MRLVQETRQSFGGHHLRQVLYQWFWWSDRPTQGPGIV